MKLFIVYMFLLSSIFVGVNAVSWLSLPNHSPVLSDAEEHNRWVAQGCWAYVGQCRTPDRTFAPCELKSNYTTPFALDDKIYKPYPVCGVKK